MDEPYTLTHPKEKLCSVITQTESCVTVSLIDDLKRKAQSDGITFNVVMAS